MLMQFGKVEGFGSLHLISSPSLSVYLSNSILVGTWHLSRPNKNYLLLI